MDSFLDGFKARLKKKDIKIGVVGLGYVGLPLAVEFVKKNFIVYGIDLDLDRIKSIGRRQSYITDISTAELRKIIDTKRFFASNDFRNLKGADVVLVCVPTPLKRKYHPDISYIRNAIKAISKNLKKRALIILESTTYPGTTEEVILPMLEGSSLQHGRDFFLCFSPERIDPGNVRYPLSKIPKVIGGINSEASLMGEAVYSVIIKKVIRVSSSRIAEMVKLLENTFRIVNIGLVDEMAMMAHKMGVDIWEIIDAAKTKPFGFMPFYPGPGVGGHCIPKDPLYLYWKAKKSGFRSRFIKLSSDMINSMPAYVVARVKDLLSAKGKKLSSSRILVVGATYKKDVKDLRKSPALDVIHILQEQSLSVAYSDPLIPYLKFKDIHLRSTAITGKGLAKFDCVIIATDHSSLDYKLILKNSKIIFDTRNVYKNINNDKVHKL
ncbi:MAG: nucleotide sugar dehydrogenase [Candidatus Omnitrophota bacterium]|nr:MAG: nucleotide sugar dehydrogenase [Candidatus Omnitrophota bacterium]